MDVLFQALANPGSMTSQQWLLLVLMLLLVVGVIYLIWRLYKVALGTRRKEPYVPNIGSRRLNAERDRRKR
jgi:flagellar biogenesis protein FliO